MPEASAPGPDPLGVLRAGLAGLALIAVAVLAGAWFARAGPDPLPPGADLEAPPPTTVGPGSVTVHVAGAVVRPGLVALTTQGRVADAIAAAGGALPGAALDALNLAAAVRDGDQIVVPFRSGLVGNQPPAAADGGSGAVDAEGRVAVNRADPGELERLPGVGPVLAARIHAYREAHGPFATVEDLLDVPGIGEGKLATLRDAVVVP